MRKNGHIWEQSRVYTARMKARDNHVDCSTWGTPAWASRETHYAMTQPSDYGGEIFPYFNLVFYYYCNHYRRSLPYKRCANLEFRGRNLLEGGVCSDIYLTSSDHANSTQNNHITVKAFASSRQAFYTGNSSGRPESYQNRRLWTRGNSAHIWARPGLGPWPINKRNARLGISHRQTFAFLRESAGILLVEDYLAWLCD